MLLKIYLILQSLRNIFVILSVLVFQETSKSLDVSAKGITLGDIYQ